MARRGEARHGITVLLKGAVGHGVVRLGQVRSGMAWFGQVGQGTTRS